MNEKVLVQNKFSKKIESLSIDKDDLKKLLTFLQERANSACEKESEKIGLLVSNEDVEQAKNQLKECSVLFITIAGIDNEVLGGKIDEVFNSVSFPDKIANFHLASNLSYQTYYNYYPSNYFELFIDFRRPKVFDFSFQPSESTPNNSHFKVEGLDNTWVNGVYHEMDDFFKKRKLRVSIIHKNSVYDVLIWFLGFPFAFWLCFKVSTIVDELIKNIFIQNAVFVYVFCMGLLILRILFHYFRWVFPMIEFRNKKDSIYGHRFFLGALTLGVLGDFLYDIIRWFFH